MIIINHDSGQYVVYHIGLFIQSVRKDNKLVPFRSCPEDVQEEIVEQLHNHLVSDMDNPYV